MKHISGAVAAEYYGKYVGDLKTNAHEVSGKVYIVDENTLRIRNFNYDGTGPGEGTILQQHQSNVKYCRMPHTCTWGLQDKRVL